MPLRRSRVAEFDYRQLPFADNLVKKSPKILHEAAGSVSLRRGDLDTKNRFTLELLRPPRLQHSQFSDYQSLNIKVADCKNVESSRIGRHKDSQGEVFIEN